MSTFLADEAPHTDADTVAKFLQRLFGAEIASERRERNADVDAARTVLSQVHDDSLNRASLPDGKSAEENLSPASAPLAREDMTESVSIVEGDKDSGEIINQVLAGRYRIVKMVGEGGMGRVYEAEHIGIGKRVAVKILHPAFTRTPDVVERFKREARAASRIEHPHVVNVTDSGVTDDGSFFFVMEFIRGIELGLLIHNEGQLDIVRSLKIAAQMCQALQAAHDAGVIHRDLKPENVLLLEGMPDGQDFVKILDFGIAKSAGMEEEIPDGNIGAGRRLTRPGVAMGTPEYMAPEQAAGKPADPRSDVYALGAIVYEMLSAEPPYDGDNVMEILHKKANEKPAPLVSLRPELPRDVLGMVDWVMARAPSARPQTMKELEGAVDQLLQQLAGVPAPGVTATLGDDTYRSRNMSDGRISVPLPTSGSMTGVGGFGDDMGLPLPKRTLPVAAAGFGLIAIIAIAKAMLSQPPVEASTLSDAVSADAVRDNATAVDGVREGQVLTGVEAPIQDPVAFDINDVRGADAVRVLFPIENVGTGDARVAGMQEGREVGRTATDDASSDSGEAEETPKPSKERTKKKTVRAKKKTGSLAVHRRRLRQARGLLKKQRFQEATLLFEKLRGTRLRGGAYLGLGQVAFQKKKYDEAAALAKKAMAAGGSTSHGVER